MSDRKAEVLNRLARGVLELGEEGAVASPRVWAALIELSSALHEVGLLPDPIEMGP